MPIEWASCTGTLSLSGLITDSLSVYLVTQATQSHGREKERRRLDCGARWLLSGLGGGSAGGVNLGIFI